MPPMPDGKHSYVILTKISLECLRCPQVLVKRLIHSSHQHRLQQNKAPIEGTGNFHVHQKRQTIKLYSLLTRPPPSVRERKASISEIEFFKTGAPMYTSECFCWIEEMTKMKMLNQMKSVWVFSFPNTYPTFGSRYRLQILT